MRWPGSCRSTRPTPRPRPRGPPRGHHPARALHDLAPLLNDEFLHLDGEPDTRTLLAADAADQRHQL